MKKLIWLIILIIFQGCNQITGTYWIYNQDKLDESNHFTSGSIIYFNKSDFYYFWGTISEINDSLYFGLGDEGFLMKGKWKKDGNVIRTTSKIIDSKMEFINKSVLDSVFFDKYYIRNETLVLADTLIYVPVKNEIFIESKKLFLR
jgi:hypothetical protein